MGLPHFWVACVAHHFYVGVVVTPSWSGIPSMGGFFAGSLNCSLVFPFFFVSFVLDQTSSSRGVRQV